MIDEARVLLGPLRRPRPVAEAGRQRHPRRHRPRRLRRRRARGGPARGPAQRPGAEQRTRRGGVRHVRPHRDRRGPGPLADGAARPETSRPDRFDDHRGGHGPGDDGLVLGLVERRPGGTGTSSSSRRASTSRSATARPKRSSISPRRRCARPRPTSRRRDRFAAPVTRRASIQVSREEFVSTLAEVTRQEVERRRARSRRGHRDRRAGRRDRVDSAFEGTRRHRSARPGVEGTRAPTSSCSRPKGPTAWNSMGSSSSNRARSPARCPGHHVDHGPRTAHALRRDDASDPTARDRGRRAAARNIALSQIGDAVAPVS